VTFQATERWFGTATGRMNYAAGGLGERPVVVIHGVTMKWQSMAEIITGLSGTTAHVYACDLRGHGRSDWAESGYQVSDYVDDIAAFVRTVSKAGTVLIGYSLGGLVAFGVAARIPDLVAGVIAIDPPLVLRDSNFEATAYSDAHDWICCGPAGDGALCRKPNLRRFRHRAHSGPSVLPGPPARGRSRTRRPNPQRGSGVLPHSTAHGRASRISGGGHGIVEGEPAAIV
jgi:pimeloyl-ACP methyl ester carboxylesterase